MTLEELDDADLVERARRGGRHAPAAFEVLVRRHQAWVVRYMRHLLGGPGVADDAAQDAFLQAYLALSRLHDPRAFRGWLRSIATRTAFNQRRTATRRTHYEERSPPPDPPPGPAQTIETEEAVLKTLAELSYPYREALVLRHIEELSIAEIADTLGISESAAKIRLLRAREAFFEVYGRLVGHV